MSAALTPTADLIEPSGREKIGTWVRPHVAMALHDLASRKGLSRSGFIDSVMERVLREEGYTEAGMLETYWTAVEERVQRTKKVEAR